MEAKLSSYLQEKLPNVPIKSCQVVLELVAEGGTVPFIARYRKEKTGNLDEVVIRDIIYYIDKFEEMEKRKEFVLQEIEAQGGLTEDLKKSILSAPNIIEIEELYRPFKKKRKTKAQVAKEAGLEPLSDWFLGLGRGELEDKMPIEEKAREFLNVAQGIVTFEHALKGAQDIIVEKIYNNTELRQFVRDDFKKHGVITSKKGKKYKPNSKYEMYTDFKESAESLALEKNSHRYLAMKRGWHEGELTVSVHGNVDTIIEKLFDFVCKDKESRVADFFRTCAKQAYSVHMEPSIANEVHRILKETADKHAIRVFTENVRKLLLGSPYGAKCVLGVDPGLRTGCKIALVDKGGNFISHTVLYTIGDQAEEKAKSLFKDVTKQIEIEAIAVGNGTAGRETENFLRKILKELDLAIPIILVSEAGASVYSASEVAREEFPDLDLTVRGAISIARRLQDPLAELVKVEPKSIGVGQYQHDVSQTDLKKSLEGTVESCVNAVGVDINTASAPLLSYVAGIGPGIAKNIVEFRKEKGLFEELSQLMDVKSFSSKTYEQGAGFLRVQNGKVVLDQTGIHPERYSAVRDMASDLNIGISELIGEGAQKLIEHRTKWAELVGEYTFDDIVKELAKPGRDPRDPYKVFQFRDDIFSVEDLKEGMVCPGIVTNVTNFGAFVDIGVHQDGLVHISELSNQFVSDTKKFISPGDQVTVKVIKVDIEKKQVGFSIKANEKVPEKKAAPRPQHSKAKEGQRKKAGSGRSQPRKDKAGGRRKSTQSHSRGDRSQKPRRGGPGGKPFNNPFAALTGFKDES